MPIVDRSGGTFFTALMVVALEADWDQRQGVALPRGPGGAARPPPTIGGRRQSAPAAG